VLQQIITVNGPIVAILGGLLLTSAIGSKMKAKNRNAAGDVVDHWNYVSISPNETSTRLLTIDFPVLFRAS